MCILVQKKKKSVYIRVCEALLFFLNEKGYMLYSKGKWKKKKNVLTPSVTLELLREADYDFPFHSSLFFSIFFKFLVSLLAIFVSKDVH